jgi:hypothetical protein
MGRRTTLFLALLLLFIPGRVTHLWAGDYSSAKNPASNRDSWEDSDSSSNDDMDKGEGDDKSDDSMEKSQFGQDSDDTYDDTSVDQDDQAKSKFNEDRDDDDDMDTDTSDEDPSGDN